MRKFFLTLVACIMAIAANAADASPDGTTVWLSVSQSTPWAWSTGSTNANRNIRLTYDAVSGTFTGGTLLACHNSVMEPGILENGREGFRLGRAFKCYVGTEANTETTKPTKYLEIGNNEYGGVAPVFTSMTEVLDYTYTEGTTEGGMAWQFGNNSDGSASFPAGSAAAENKYAMVYVQIDLNNKTAKLSLTPFASGTVDPEPEPEPDTTVWLSVSQSTPWAWSTGSTNANRNIKLTYDAASGTYTGGTYLACHNSIMEPGILEDGRTGFRLGRAFKCYLGDQSNTETTKPKTYLEIGNNEYGGVAPVFTSMTEVLDYTYTEGTTEGGMAWQFGNNSDGSASFPAGSAAAANQYAMVYVQIDLNNKTAKLSLTPFVGGTVDPEPDPEPQGNSVTFNFTGVEDAYKYVTAFNLQDDDNPMVTFDAATSTFNYPAEGTGLIFSASNGYEIEITCPEASQPGTNYQISQDMGYMLQLWAGANGYTFTVNVTDPTPAAPEYLQMATGTSMGGSSVTPNPATDAKVEKVSDGIYEIKNVDIGKNKAFYFYTGSGSSLVKYNCNSYGYVRFLYLDNTSYNWPDASVDPSSVNYSNILENGTGAWFVASFPTGLDNPVFDITVNLNDMKLSVTAVDPNPQTAMDLYLVGANINGNADQWESKDYAFEKQSDGTYKWSGSSLGSEFKINGGDWTTYNIGAPADGNNVLTLGQKFTVVNDGNSQNIKLGLYPTILNPVVVLDYDAMTLTITGTYGYPETMYILGNVDGSKFVPESATAMEPQDMKAGVFSLEVSITSDPDDPQYGYVQFATQKAPANSQDPWNQMGIRLGATEQNLLVTVDEDTKSVTYPLTTNDFSFKVTPGDYNVEVNYTNAVPQVTFTEAEKPADGKSMYVGVTTNGTWPNAYNTNYVLPAAGESAGNNMYPAYEGTVTLPVGASFNLWWPANINADGISNFMPMGPSDEKEGKEIKFTATDMTFSDGLTLTTDGFWTLANDQEIEMKITADMQTRMVTFECLTQLGGNTDPEPEPEPGPGGLMMYVVTQAAVPAGNFANEVSADNVQLSYNASNGTYEGGVMIANKNGTPYNRSFRVYSTTEAGTAQTYYTGSKASEYGNEQFTFTSESEVLSSTMKTTTEKTGFAWSVQANTGWPAGTQAATDGYAMLYMQIDVTNMTAKFSMSPFESEEPKPEPEGLKMYVVTQAAVPAGNFDAEVSAENVQLTYNASNDTYEGGVMIANKNGTGYNRSFRVYTTNEPGKAETYYTGSKSSEYGNEQFTFTSESEVLSSTMKTTTEKTGFAWSVQANTGWPAGTQAATDGYAMVYMQIDLTNMSAKFSMSPFSSEEPGPQLPENIDVTYNFENLEDIMSYNSAITNSSAWPADGTTANKAFDFGQTFELKSEGITLTTEKNNGTTSPRVYLTSAGAYTFRVYNGNYFTVSAPEGYQVDEVIVKVGTTTNTNLAKTTTLDPAKYGEFTAVNKVGTWTSPEGKSFNSVPFVVNSTNLFITSIEVKASKASGEIEPEPEPQGNSVTFNFTGVADAYKYVTAFSLTDDDNPQVTFDAATSKFEYPKGGTGLIFSASNGYELSITCPEASVPGQNYMISEDAGYMLQLFDGANGYTFTVNVTDPTPEPTYLYVVGQDFGGGTPTNAVALVAENGYYTYTTANWSKISTVKADWNSGFDANALNAQGTAQAVQEQTLKLVKGTANMPLPYAATFTYKIKEDLSEVTVIGDVPPASKYTELYVRGSMNSWGTDNNWKLETEDGVLYVLKNVSIASGATFKIGASNWNPGYGVSATIDADKLYTLNTNPTGNDITMGAAVNGATVSFSTETLAFLVSTDGKTVADFGNVPNYSAWYVNVMGTFEGGGDSMTSPYGQPDTDGIAVIDNVAIGTNTFEIKTWDGKDDAYYSYGDQSVPVGEWVQLADAQGVRSTVEGATADAVYQVKFDVTNNQVFLTKTAGSDPEPEPEVLKMYVVTNATVPAGNFNSNVSADNVELAYNAENGTYEGGIVIANKNGTAYDRSFRVYTTDVAGQAQTYYTGSKSSEYGNEQFIFTSEAEVIPSTMKTTTESTGYAWSVNINGGWPAGSDAAEWGYGALYMQIDVKNMTAKFSMTPFNGVVIPVLPPVPPVAEGELVLNPGTDFTLQSGEINNEAKTIVMESLQETVTIYIEAPVNATVYYQITDVAPNEPATIALEGYTPAKQLVDGPFTVELKNATTGKLNLYFELDGLQSEIVTYSYTCNYATPSGINGIGAEEEDVDYYTLDGVKVQNPERGIYIRVKNGVVTKVVR